MGALKAIDLFAGAGGLTLGLQRAGFDVRAALEWDKWAAETYRKNIGPHVIQKDIREVPVSELLRVARVKRGECALLAGGPPCQGFSVQRRGPDQDPRNELVLEFLRFVEGIRPQYFLMENVAGLASKRGKPFVRTFLESVAKLEYRTEMKTVDAVEFGVPQYRRRVILIGKRTDVPGSFRFPEGQLSPSEYRTVRDAIAGLPTPPPDGTPHADIPNHAREAKLSALNIERLRHIPEGGGREHLPQHLQLPCHRNNPNHRHVEVYGRLAWDRPSGTITARFDSFTRGRFGHPFEDRSLTLREGARLQTFPDDFVFTGNREEGAKQIGNAVPPLLAEALGRTIIEALKGSYAHPSIPIRGETSQIALAF